MAAISVEELYERYVRPLSEADRRRLVELTERELDAADEKPIRRSIMELHGLGAEIWRELAPSSTSTSCAPDERPPSSSRMLAQAVMLNGVKHLCSRARTA